MRNFRKIVFSLFAIVVLTSGIAAARDGNQRLFFLTSPASTRPLFSLPGQQVFIDVKQSVYQSCSCAFHSYVSTSGLKMEFREIGKKVEFEGIAGTVPGGTDFDLDVFRFPAKIPGGLSEGIYDIETAKGSNRDISKKSLVIYNKFPESYTVLIASGIRVGRAEVKDGEAPWFSSESMMEHLSTKINELQPEFVIFSGGLTKNGAPDEFKKFIELAEIIKKPVIAVPGTGDGARDAISYFGPSNFNISFGEHNYIAWYAASSGGAGAESVLEQIISPESALNIVIAPSLQTDNAYLALKNGADIIITENSDSISVPDGLQALVNTVNLDEGKFLLLDIKDSTFAGIREITLSD